MKRPRPNGDPLDEIAAVFDEGMARITQVEQELVRVRADNADVAALRKVQDEMRAFTEDRVDRGLERGQSKLEDKLANMRAVMLSEFDERLKSSLSEWTEQHITPLFDQLIRDREERLQRKRDEQVQRWRNRLTLGTAALLFIVSMYQTFRPKPDNARDYTRPIERLSDVVN